MIGGYFVYKWVVNKNYEGEDDCVLRDWNSHIHCVYWENPWFWLATYLQYSAFKQGTNL